MRTELNKLFLMKPFFTILQLTDNSSSVCVSINLKQPSHLLIKNIHANWLRYNYAKSEKHHLPIYINDATSKTKQFPTVCGIINQELQVYDKHKLLELQLNNLTPLKKSLLKFNLLVPEQDAVQYLIQWQRYRKYWWSTLSTTPSLFSVNEFRYEGSSAYVDIVAQLPNGELPVESLCFKPDDKNDSTTQLTCSMCLENALFILLLDGLHSSEEEEEDYLRLHRKIAPFKISFAVNSQKQSINEAFLRRLATLLYHKLESNKISAWLPDFSLPLDLQIKENLKMGVTYTAILEDETLEFGIFKLMNSSTKLSEQMHVADFCKYAAVIFDSKS